MSVRDAIGGWLLLLCLLLLVWAPVNLALAASNALAALPIRGFSLGVILMVRILVTAFGIAAGLSLAMRHGAAIGMTKIALILSALMDLIVYLTPFVPSHRFPGDTSFYVAASLLYHGAWLTYLAASRRVRMTFS